MINIFRQYPVVNGFIQVPPNKESEKTKYIVGNQLENPTGSSIAFDSLDSNQTKYVVVRKNTEYLEVLTSRA
jgi:hypothetical protein